jgi:hypothetical protein
VLKHLQRLYNFRSTNAQKRLRWNTQQQRKRALDQLCFAIGGTGLTEGRKGRKEDRQGTIIAFGAAGFSSCSAGHAPAPKTALVKCLSKYYTVIMVDEYLTSQVCSCCGERCLEAPKHLQVTVKKPDQRKPNGSRRSYCKRLDQSKKYRLLNTERQYFIAEEECVRNGLRVDDDTCAKGDSHKKKGVAGQAQQRVEHDDDENAKRGRLEKAVFTEVHGVRICSKCHIKWNRDVNAALNIRRIFLHMNANGGERPCNMRRPTVDPCLAAAAAAQARKPQSKPVVAAAVGVGAGQRQRLPCPAKRASSKSAAAKETARQCPRATSATSIVVGRTPASLVTVGVDTSAGELRRSTRVKKDKPKTAERQGH